MTTRLTPSTVVGVALAGSLLLAVAGLVRPWLSEDAGPPMNARLPAATPVIAHVLVADTAHFLGEPFEVVVAVAYRTDVVEVTPESLREASFAPFEQTRDMRAAATPLNESVSEYRFSAELRAIDVLPGQAYRPLPVVIEYRHLETSEVSTLEVEFPQPLHVSAYYGEAAGETPLRPLRGSLPARSSSPMLLAAAAALLVGAAGLVVVAQRRGAVWEEPASTRRARDVVWLRQTLALAHDEAWRASAPPRERLKDLEGRALYFAHRFLDVGPITFWEERDNPAWQRLHTALAARYRSAEPSERDVREVLAGLADLLAPVLDEGGVA